ncbi:NAD(P)-binding domain-containing protein [Kitasatospora sp. NPDC002227]|uniref:NAD(P)-binding domain-containing protein n=1 Tax=Kitasatospora sp. NPDC002227 TaxID=3154773 RepID=UPI0033200F41
MSPEPPVTVIGAGPYGLAVAAHLKARQVPMRVLGEPMESWRERMPAGMYLKSTPHASAISDPVGRYRFLDFRAQEGTGWVGDRYPIPVEEFIRYGEWFQRRCVPELERATVLGVSSGPGGLRVRLDSGEEYPSRAVVLATGLGPYPRVPELLAPLVKAGLASHTADHADLSRFAGQRVAVIGAGQSALESAALLHEAGAEPTVVARARHLVFGTPPVRERSRDRSPRERLAHPGSTLGPGWPLLAYSKLPGAFRQLPDHTRAAKVRSVLGPAGAWWLRERVEGRFPTLVGHSLRAAEENGAGVRLELQGHTPTLEIDHVLAATGYRPDVNRLTFLDPVVRLGVRHTPEGSPRLAPTFESSVPGLYFAGLSAADTFGPVMRFVAGTGYAARRISAALA